MLNLMNRWFSSATCECICSDIVMSRYNFDLIKEVYMINFMTLNNEYTLEFDWKDHYLPVNNNLVRICNISFRNNILNKIMHTISFSLESAIVILDNLCQYMDMGMNYLDFPIKGISQSYIFNIQTNKDTNSPYYNNLLISIYEVDPIYRVSSPIETFYLESDSQLQDLMYQIYFAFIIDVDSGDMSLMESIYDKLINQV